METWIETRTGKKVSILNPQPDQIDIDDIAYSLSNLCRFNGHSAGFLSVAEHSVLVAARLPQRLKLAGLLHDAAEAYLGDVPSPIKQFLPDWAKLEGNFLLAINEKFKLELSNEDWQEVKHADLLALATEAHYLMESQGKDYSMFNGPVKYEVNHSLMPACLPPQIAFQLFMGMYHDLTKSPIIVA